MHACLFLRLIYSMDAYIICAQQQKMIVLNHDAGSGSPTSISTDSSEHEPDLYAASKSSKAVLTLDIAKCRIYSSTAVERGAQSSAV